MPFDVTFYHNPPAKVHFYHVVHGTHREQMNLGTVLLNRLLYPSSSLVSARISMKSMSCSVVVGLEVATS